MVYKDGLSDSGPYCTVHLFELQEGGVGYSPRQVRVFLVDSLLALGYTLAGLRHLSIYERSTEKILSPGVFKTGESTAAWSHHPLPFKEVLEWQSQ